MCGKKNASAQLDQFCVTNVLVELWWILQQNTLILLMPIQVIAVLGGGGGGGGGGGSILIPFPIYAARLPASPQPPPFKAITHLSLTQLLIFRYFCTCMYQEKKRYLSLLTRGLICSQTLFESQKCPLLCSKQNCTLRGRYQCLIYRRFPSISQYNV